MPGTLVAVALIEYLMQAGLSVLPAPLRVHNWNTAVILGMHGAVDCTNGSS